MLADKVSVCCVTRDGGVREWRQVINALHFTARLKTFWLEGESDISQARSALASRWLSETLGRSGGEWSLWLDDDIVVDYCRLLEFVDRAVASRWDMVAGVYAGKRKDSGLVATRFMSSPVLVGDKGGFVSIAACGFGCVLVRRTVFERVAKMLPCVRYHRREWGDVLGRPYFAGCVVRDQEDVDGPMIHLGEDFSFCHRARSQGCDLAADTRLRVGHRGSYVYHVEDVQCEVATRSTVVLHVSGVEKV